MANTLSFSRNWAVGFIEWLDFGALLRDEFVIKFAFAVNHLTAANRTTLNVATEDVEFAFPDAAIVTRLSVCSPVILLLAVTNAVEFVTADTHEALD